MTIDPIITMYIVLTLDRLRTFFEIGTMILFIGWLVAFIYFKTNENYTATGSK